MSESRDNEGDPINDCWITNWEQETLQELENEEDYEGHLHREIDAANQKLWTLFQSTAQCVAVMYKGSTDGQHSLWIPFQTAAGHVTALYKDAIDSVRRASELGVQAGYQRRTRELLNMARRRRHIRREDLLAFLAGKTAPPRTTHFKGSPRAWMTPRLPSPHHTHVHAPDQDLSTFREALSISGPTGLTVRPPSVGSPTTLSARRRNSSHLTSTDLQAFICEEFARHNKRPAPSSSPTHDVTMDSPQHKKSRFT